MQENGTLGCKVENSKCWVGHDDPCSDDFKQMAGGGAGGSQFIQGFEKSLPDDPVFNNRGDLLASVRYDA